MAKFRDAQRFCNITQGIFRNDPVLRFAENQTNAGLIVGVAEKIVDGREVKIQLPGVLRLEWPHFEIDDNEASQLQVIEEQIEFEVFSSDFEQDLTAHECEPDSELDQKLAQVREKFPLQVELVRFSCESEKIEV